jgi:hypothetical protein
MSVPFDDTKENLAAVGLSVEDMVEAHKFIMRKQLPFAKAVEMIEQTASSQSGPGQLMLRIVCVAAIKHFIEIQERAKIIEMIKTAPELKEIKELLEKDPSLGVMLHG